MSRNDVGSLQRLDIDERQTGEAAEHEAVADALNSGEGLQVERHQRLQFRLGQELTLGLCTLEATAEERVFRNPLVGDGVLEHILQIAQVTHGGVVGAFLAHAQEMLEVLDETAGYILDGNVLLAELQVHELFEVGDAAFPPAVSDLADVTALHLFLALDIGLAEYIAEHLRLLHLPEEIILHDLRVDEFALVHKLVVDFVEARAHHLQELVQFKVAARAATGHLSALVPVFRVNLAADCELHTLSVGGDSGIEGIFSVPLCLWLSCIESQGEKRIFHCGCWGLMDK